MKFLKKTLDWLKIIGIFLLCWTVMAAILYGLIQLNFLIKSYTEFGKSFILWFTQALAFVSAIYLTLLFSKK